MEELVEALQIFLKYGNPDHATHCEQGEFRICGIKREDVSDEDMKRLDELSFFYDEWAHAFVSFR